VSTPTLKSSHKPWKLAPTVGLMRSSYVRAMAFQSTTKFLPGLRCVLGFLLFIADMFEVLKLQEPESHEVIRSGTDCLPPALVWVDLVSEAQPGHKFIKLGKTDPDPLRDKADHTSTILAAITNLVYQSSEESDSEGNKEVYMVG
jgi:hypothetical protein